MSLAKALIHRIDSHPASLKRIAAATQISYSSLRKFRLGRSDLRLEAAERLMSFLELDVAIQPPVETAIDGGRNSDFSEWLVELMRQIDLVPVMEDVLDQIYSELSGFIAFQRIGYATVDLEQDKARAAWCRSERPPKIARGYSARLSTSSLRFVIETQRPRILDLLEFLRNHPESAGTRLMVDEGFCVSLAYPVISSHVVVGLLFFNSVDPCAFGEDEIKRCSMVAREVGRLHSLQERPAEQFV